MLQNYLTTFIRIFIRQKIYSAINVLGLAIGIAAALLLALYITDELSYDKFHDNADRIYRVSARAVLAGQPAAYALSGAPVAENMYRDFAGIESYCRLWLRPVTIIEYETRNISDQHLIMADSNFFSFFSFRILAGNPKTSLTGSNKVVLSETMAQAIFGITDKNYDSVIGKQILLGASKVVTEVTAICENPPSNSHLHFDAVLSSDSSLPEKNNTTGFLHLGCYSYIMLKPQVKSDVITNQIRSFVLKHVAPQWSRVNGGGTLEEWEKKGNEIGFYLTPITNIHLDSHAANEFEANGNRQNLYILGAIACFALLLACLNFINLSTARASNRAKEVGIRKTIGAPKRKLMAQFMTESFLYTILATIVGLGLVSLFISPFNILAGKELSAYSILSVPFLLGIVSLILIVAFLCGSYPAFVLSAIRPARILKGQVGPNRHSARNMMVIFQFIVSTTLIVTSLMIFRQIRYLQTTETGFNKEDVICLSNASDLGSNSGAFKNEVKSNPLFKQVSFCSIIPSEIINAAGHRRKGDQEWKTLYDYTADEDYLDALDLKLVEGRFFSKEFNDSTAVVINEAAASLLGIPDLKQNEYMEDPGELIPRQIIGIVKDFNFESLKNEIRPLVIYYGADSRAMIRLSARDNRLAIDELQRIWEKHSDTPFGFSFLDERLQAQYEEERILSQVSLVFTIVSILVASLGLLGLVTYMALQRTKEIGIRKIMGASVRQIVVLLSKEFLRLVIIAFVIAIPISWYGINEWLKTFAYRTDFSLAVAGSAGIAVVSIALVTLSYQSIKAAIGNPVDSLRNE